MKKFDIYLGNLKRSQLHVSYKIVCITIHTQIRLLHGTNTYSITVRILMITRAISDHCLKYMNQVVQIRLYQM